MEKRWFWIALGGAAATTLLACWAAWVLMIQPMDAAVKTANALEKTFSAKFALTPRISANAGVLFSQTARVENLVTARRTLSLDQTLETPLATGNLPRVRAEFLGEAGIAGRDPVEIKIRRGGREADVILPRIKILHLETTGEPVVEAPGPAWNALPGTVRARTMRQLRLAARQRLLDGGLAVEAQRELRARIESLAAESGCQAVFEGDSGNPGR